MPQNRLFTCKSLFTCKAVCMWISVFHRYLVDMLMSHGTWSSCCMWQP